MNEWQKQELNRIFSNSSALGAFSGMILRLHMEYPKYKIQDIVKHGLRVRDTIRMMAQNPEMFEDEQSSGQNDNNSGKGKQTIKL